MKRLGVAGFVLAAVFLIATLVTFLAAIWTGDWRWGNTGIAMLCMTVVCGGLSLGVTS
jgi:hypothetical protein